MIRVNISTNLMKQNKTATTKTMKMETKKKLVLVKKRLIYNFLSLCDIAQIIHKISDLMHKRSNKIMARFFEDIKLLQNITKQYRKYRNKFNIRTKWVQRFSVPLFLNVAFFQNMFFFSMVCCSQAKVQIAVFYTNLYLVFVVYIYFESLGTLINQFTSLKIFFKNI